MTSLKQGIIQDKEGIIMRTVFGIDVSKASSEVAILVNSETVHALTSYQYCSPVGADKIDSISGKVTCSTL